MKSEITAALLAIIAVIALSNIANAQKSCGVSKEDDEKYEQIFRNGSESAVTIKVIDENCDEHSVTVEPGKAAKYEPVYSGYKFRIGTKEVAAAYSNYIITVGVAHSGDARVSFLDTVNQFRRGHKLAELTYDDRLNQAAQWFADLLAKYEADAAGHDAVAAGGEQYKDMQDSGQRAAHFGWKGKGGVAEVVAGDQMLNIGTADVVGGYFALAWSSGTTHYAPFFDIGEQKFNKVGFAVAESKKTKGKFYAVALFGTD